MKRKDIAIAYDRIGLAKIIQAFNRLSLTQLNGLGNVENLSFDEIFERLVSACEKLAKENGPFFEFEDTKGELIRKDFICQFRKDYNEKDLPIIILNDWPDKIIPKNNPICRKILTYANEEKRNKDFEKLKTYYDGSKR